MGTQPLVDVRGTSPGNCRIGSVGVRKFRWRQSVHRPVMHCHEHYSKWYTLCTRRCGTAQNVYTACGRRTGPAAMVLYRSIQLVYENSVDVRVFMNRPVVDYHEHHYESYT